MHELKIVRVRRQSVLAVHDGERPAYLPTRKMLSSSDVYQLFRERFDHADREEFLAVLIDGKGRSMGFNQVSVGTLTASLVHPREIFKAAFLANAASRILVHNHPSGDPEPSPEDVALTERLRAAGELLGVKIVDHVIIGDGSFRSFVDDGRI